MTAYFTTLLQVTAQLTSLVAILREHVQDPVSVWMKKFAMAWKMASREAAVQLKGSEHRMGN